MIFSSGIGSALSAFGDGRNPVLYHNRRPADANRFGGLRQFGQPLQSGRLCDYTRPAMPTTQRTLMAMYRALRGRFGPRHWWPAAPGLSPAAKALEICVGAILTQNTSWLNVEKALASLTAAGCMSVSKLHAMSPASLARLIRSAGYFNVKARRLKSFIARVADGFGGDIEAFLGRPAATLRQDLLSINGIGPETADSMILYAAGKAAFVVDAYTCRVLTRHRLIEPGADYRAVQALLESSQPRRIALWNDCHAQFVAVGKDFCKPTARCAGCPLESFPHDADAPLKPVPVTRRRP